MSNFKRKTTINENVELYKLDMDYYSHQVQISNSYFISGTIIAFTIISILVQVKKLDGLLLIFLLYAIFLIILAILHLYFIHKHRKSYSITKESLKNNQNKNER